jgi:type I restriction enzyme S subunit
MKSFEIHDTEDHITEEAIRQSATTKLRAGAVLMVTRSGILRHTFPVAVTRVDAAVNQDLKALLPFAGLLPEFIVYALRRFSDDILHPCSKNGTTVQSIEFLALKEFADESAVWKEVEHHGDQRRG